MKSFFTPKDVYKVCTVSYRQLQYWDKTNFIRPSYRRRGKYRLYTFTDLIQIWVAKKLRNSGYSIQVLRSVIRDLRKFLPQTCHPLVDLAVLVRNERILIFDGEVMGNAVEDYHCFHFAELRDLIDDTFPEFIASMSDSLLMSDQEPITTN